MKISIVGLHCIPALALGNCEIEQANSAMWRLCLLIWINSIILSDNIIPRSVEHDLKELSDLIVEDALPRNMAEHLRPDKVCPRD
ncbi:MAG: hypothetical protein ACXWF8_13585 [Methylobacter sp.]